MHVFTASRLEILVVAGKKHPPFSCVKILIKLEYLQILQGV